MPKKPVLCVGCCVLDFITITKTFPVEDSDRRCERGYWQRGGNASNNCTVLRKLGLDVEFFGVLSNSAAFRMLNEDLCKHSITTENCPRTEIDPPFSTVILAKDTGSRTIVHCNMNYPYVSYAEFERLDLSRYGWVHFEARVVDETIKMIKRVKAYNASAAEAEMLCISLDLESCFEYNFPMIEFVDYVVCSKDLAQQCGWHTPKAACAAIAEKLHAQNICKTTHTVIVCPWAALGTGCMDSMGKYAEVPAQPVKKVIDSLGAGDTFMAALIYALYFREQRLSTAVRFANAVAAYKIQHNGYDKVGDVLKNFQN